VTVTVTVATGQLRSWIGPLRAALTLGQVKASAVVAVAMSMVAAVT
jgi:hypothetical protein